MIPHTPGRADSAGFRLELGRTLWHFIGTEKTEDWLAKFARILELEPWRPGPSPRQAIRRLFFIGGRDWTADSDTSFQSFAAAAGLPREGWKPHYLNPALIRTHTASQDVVLEVRLIDHSELAVENMAKSCFALYEPIVAGEGLVLHAALIERNGLGVALAGSGGTGKSTCTRRLPAAWKALCDDTCLILPDGRGGFQAHPFATWSDYLWKRSEGTWKVESHVPLAAVFFLKKAEEDRAEPIGRGEASIYLSRSSHEILSVFLRFTDRDRARSLRRKIFENACSLSRAVRAYSLEVELEGRFWTKIEKALDS
jgi:SynChlorMet cassette protein ScmC